VRQALSRTLSHRFCFGNPFLREKGKDMKNHLIVAIVALATSTGLATAGGRDGNSYQSQVSVNAASQAIANSQSSSVSVAQGGNVTFNTPANTSQRIHQSGTTTIRSAPQVVAPSMSSGHPCAYAPVSVGVSVVGFGGAFGGQRIDDACLLAQMQVRNAAIAMIAARNPAACRALEMAGNIAPGYCGGSRRAAVPAPRPVRYAAVAPAPRQQVVRRATLPPQVTNPAPQVRNLGKVAKEAKKPQYTQVQQLKKMGKNCTMVFATASSKKMVCS
jgi:hypothetical protein